MDMGEGAFANPIHWIFAIIVLVLVFGASKLGDIGGALGKSVREFKDATQQAAAPSAPAAALQPPTVPEYRPSAPDIRPAAVPNGAAAAPDHLPRV
jgi:sec-independent protein translocase protein TatA